MQPQFVSVTFFVLFPACLYAVSFSPMDDLPFAYGSQELVSIAPLSNNSPSSPQPEPLRATEFNLNAYQWRHRVVLVFAPSNQFSAYQQQLQAWKSDLDGIRDRDLQLVEVLVAGTSRVDRKAISPASADALRRQFKVAATDFAVILIGKDGTEKQRSQNPVELSRLFRTIDAMPMRQQEMRSQRSPE